MIGENTMQKQNILLEKVTFVRPGGNDTAIVWDDITRENQGDISKDIQRQYESIEQVIFVERQNDGSIRGHMAGGEFCGNATRSLGYLLLNGQDGEINIVVSGSNKTQTITVKNQFAKTSIPILNDLNCVQIDKDGYQVMMDGIAFLIVEKSICGSGMQKQAALDILNRKGLAMRYPASGLILLDRKADNLYTIDPYVYVRDTETLYYETGCGSGSTSVGLMLSKQSGDSLDNIEIQQPSGMSLYVSVERNKREFLCASVNGPIEILSEQSITVSLPSVTQPKVA